CCIIYNGRTITPYREDGSSLPTTASRNSVDESARPESIPPPETKQYWSPKQPLLVTTRSSSGNIE
ncbi:hypothetical protein, partial [Porphyromonas sp.]|uniref:hypothetical protein n=1 Tax=Porphyromonas sp. TaxID=1924944 RepID=UPI00257D5A44